jgi:hypothetical protein
VPHLHLLVLHVGVAVRVVLPLLSICFILLNHVPAHEVEQDHPAALAQLVVMALRWQHDDGNGGGSNAKKAVTTTR